MSTVTLTDGYGVLREVCDCQIWRYFHLNQTATYGDNLYPLTGLLHVNVYYIEKLHTVYLLLYKPML